MRVQVSALILLISQPILAATEVGGHLSSTTWTAAGNPYRVTSTLTIPRGETLVVEGGVAVSLDSAVSLRVEGSLQVLGCERGSVVFAASTAHGWGGIRMSGGDTSSIRYAHISGVLKQYLVGGWYYPERSSPDGGF